MGQDGGVAREEQLTFVVEVPETQLMQEAARGHKRLTWATPIGEMWQAVYPGSEPPWKLFQQHLKPLTLKHPVSEICARLKPFLLREGTSRSTWLLLQDFAATYGRHVPRERPDRASGTVVPGLEETQAMLARYRT